MHSLPRKAAAICVLAAAFPSPAAASAPECPLTYETFELAVPHIDLEECPEGDLRDVAFCRVSTGGERFHLFYFGNEGDHCLLGVETFDEEDYTLVLRP